MELIYGVWVWHTSMALTFTLREKERMMEVRIMILAVIWLGVASKTSKHKFEFGM